MSSSVLNLENTSVRAFKFTPKRVKETKEGQEETDPYADITLRVTGPQASLMADLARWAQEGEIDIAVHVAKRLGGTSSPKERDEEGKPLKAGRANV